MKYCKFPKAPKDKKATIESLLTEKKKRKKKTKKKKSEEEEDQNEDEGANEEDDYGTNEGNNENENEENENKPEVKKETIDPSTLNYMENDKLKWETYPSLNITRHSSSFFIYNEKYLYVFFGYNSSKGSIESIEKMDLDVNTTWENVVFQNPKSIDLHLNSHGSIFANTDEVYLVGGCVNERFTDRIIKFNLVQNCIFPTEFVFSS